MVQLPTDSYKDAQRILAWRHRKHAVRRTIAKDTETYVTEAEYNQVPEVSRLFSPSVSLQA